MEKPVTRPFFIRNLNAGQLLETFLVSAVAAFLGVRFFLGVTGYPRLGGGGLHIAHMLWGGTLMVAAVLLLLSYLGQRIRRAAAVIGGLGFGLFIDELGKFITSDNNYFYRPAIALIYGVFVLLFLWWRALERHRVWDEQTYLANALMLLQDAAQPCWAISSRRSPRGGRTYRGEVQSGLGCDGSRGGSRAFFARAGRVASLSPCC